MEKCKLRAKSCVYWPGIYKDIERLVSTCEPCLKFQKSQMKEPMIPTDVPPRPWHTVGADLFYTNGSWYLIIADYYSKFPFIRKLETLQASTIIRLTRVLFAEQGIPEAFICDNGSQFTSREFRNLAEIYGFKIITSSPYYPKGHGFIERHIQTVENVLMKCKESGDDPNLALLSLRATPLKANMPSPAELLNGRKYKTTLPSKIHPPCNQEEIRTYLTSQQEVQTQHYNQHVKPLPELFEGQHVHIQSPTKKTWTPARIVSAANTPRSYNVETETGSQLRRNRVHLRPRRINTDTMPCNTDHTSPEKAQFQPTTKPSPIKASRATRSRSNIQMPSKYKDYEC